jgi:excinuclease ABC subunit B
MQKLLDVSEYRRARQLAYNEEHGVTPKSVRRAVQESLHVILKAREVEQGIVNESPADFDLNELIRELERDMASAAAGLEYERAALLRDQIAELKSGSGIAKVEPGRVRTKYPSGRRGRKRSVV